MTNPQSIPTDDQARRKAADYVLGLTRDLVLTLRTVLHSDAPQRSKWIDELWVWGQYLEKIEAGGATFCRVRDACLSALPRNGLRALGGSEARAPWTVVPRLRLSVFGRGHVPGLCHFSLALARGLSIVSCFVYAPYVYERWPVCQWDTG